MLIGWSLWLGRRALDAAVEVNTANLTTQSAVHLQSHILLHVRAVRYYEGLFILAASLAKPFMKIFRKVFTYCTGSIRLLLRTH